MLLTFAQTPKKLSAPIVSTISGSLTSSVTGSIYLQCRNRQGFNLISSPTPIALEAGQGISVTIPDCLTGCAWEILEFYVLFSATTYVDATVLASYSDLDVLPGTVTLTRDEHFAVRVVLSLESQLPTNRVKGMRREVTSWGEIREWNGSAWSPVYPNDFQTLVGSVFDRYGMAEPLPVQDERILKIPDYGMSSSAFSEPVTYWLVNDTQVDYPSGLGVSIAIFWDNNQDLTDLFFASGGTYTVFNGYVNTQNGQLDTASATGGNMPYLGEDFLYTSNRSAFTLDKPLRPDWAVSISVKFNLSLASLNGRIGHNAIIRISLQFAATVGVYSGTSVLLGNAISPDGDRRMIVPAWGLQATALSGSGSVAGRTFINAPPQTVIPLVANTANQKIAINGNGTCYSVANINSSYEELRAVVGTVNGPGVLIAHPALITLGGNVVLQIVLTHPTAIRSDYPDQHTRGSQKGEFNATGAKAYLTLVGGTTTEYDLVVDPDAESQIFTLGGGGGVESALPVSDLGLYAPQITGVYTPTGASLFAAGSYSLAIAYYYENTVTSIRNDLGTILMIEGNIFTMIQEAKKDWLPYILALG